MKYSRMLFLPKNDSLIVNTLAVIEHSVKNKKNVKFQGISIYISGNTLLISLSSIK
jgi:hypothetical protein